MFKRSRIVAERQGGVAAHVEEAHALLAGEVHSEAVEQVFEGLDRAGDELLAGNGAVRGDPRPVMSKMFQAGGCSMSLGVMRIGSRSGNGPDAILCRSNRPGCR